MFQPCLPGHERDQEQMESSRALDVLLDAESIEDLDPDFIGMVQEELDRRRDALDRVEARLVGLTEASDRPNPSSDGFGATTRVEDFIARMRAEGRKNEARTDETPEARRRRIAMGKGKKKIVGNKVLVAFT